jgi:hypothetical protein
MYEDVMLISEASVLRELLLCSWLWAARVLPQSVYELSNREERTCAYLSFLLLSFDGVRFALQNESSHVITFPTFLKRYVQD